MRALHHPQTILQCNSPDWRRAQGCKVAAARENSDDSADQNMRTQTMRCDILECSRCTPRMKKQRLVHRKLAQSCVPYTPLLRVGEGLAACSSMVSSMSSTPEMTPYAHSWALFILSGLQRRLLEPAQIATDFALAV